MTLIDIDPLKERIDKEVKEGKVLDGWAFFIKAYLDSEPNIDIVQCEECKYWTYEESCGFFNNKPTCFDDFCSYGEREDE